MAPKTLVKKNAKTSVCEGDRMAELLFLYMQYNIENAIIYRKLLCCKLARHIRIFQRLALSPLTELCDTADSSN